jgi:hypothetical protein
VEVLSFVLDSIAMLIALYFGFRDDRRPPGAPQKSPFRTFEYDALSRKNDSTRGKRDQIIRNRTR